MCPELKEPTPIADEIEPEIDACYLDISVTNLAV